MHQKSGHFSRHWATIRPCFDPGDNVHKMFHVEGIPQSFLFGRDGKLVAVAEDQRTQRQFLAMLAQAGLQP